MDYSDFEQQLRNNAAAPSDNQQPSAARDDVDMAHNDNDDLPPLEPIPGSASAPQAVEVEMQTAVDDPPVPEVDVAAPPQPRPNRRARVEDDDDEDRDRRHPSERIITPLPSFSMSTSPSQPELASFFDLLGAPSPSAPAPAPAPSTASTAPNAPPPPPINNGPTPLNLPEFMTGGIAISFDIGPGLPGGEPPAEGGPGPFPGFSTDTLRDMFGLEPDVEDPERAERLIKGLEEVPVGLVRRLERVGGMTGANGEDLSGGDSGCAVCWEKLLDQDDEAEESEEKGSPKIVSLPCAHVFHADCLRPWFSRPKHTTCPTCRFNIDPEDLTYVPYRQRRHTQEQQQQTADASSQPAQAPAAGNPAPTPSAAGPAPSSSTTTPATVESDDARGRTGPASAPDTTSRRTNSEPPTNRPPRPAQRPDMIQSFAVPGGHIVVVNQPLGILTDAQGRPAASVTAQQQPQETSRAPAPTAATGAAGTEAQQPSASQAGAQVPRPQQATTPPAPGANPYNAIPRMTMPGGGQLPAGVVAFDIHLPFPLPFPHQAGPQQANPPQATPMPAQGQPFRPPGTGFAGINFGQAGGPVDVSDIMRRLFTGIPMPTPPTNTGTPINNPAPANAATPPANANPAPSPNPATPSPAAGGRPPTPQTNANAQGQPADDPEAIGIENLLRSYLNNPEVMFRLLMSAALSGAIPVGAMPGGRPQSRTEPNAPKKQWAPPAAPGPTLRQRVEKREREAGLRCFDVSCGVGPSDEDPFVALSDALKKRCSIQSKDDGDAKVCSHTFHSSCLVSAERVALRGADAAVVDGHVEVSCPVCRGAGMISKVDWDDGVMQLA